MDISTTTKLRNDIADELNQLCHCEGYARSRFYIDGADRILAMVDKAQNPSKVVPLRRETPADGDAA